MPFKSEKQRGFMFSKHPEIAEEFEKKTPKGKKLPKKKGKHDGPIEGLKKARPKKKDDKDE